MIVRNLLVFVLCLFLSLGHLPAKAQNGVSAVISQSGKTSFKIQRAAFCIYLSDKGQIEDYSLNAQGRVSYDLKGRLESAGSTTVSYDLNNRIERIGNETISYDLHNRIEQIGAARISYDLHNRIEQIGSVRISYDLHGRVDYVGS